jgi:hypothetical protein
MLQRSEACKKFNKSKSFSNGGTKRVRESYRRKSRGSAPKRGLLRPAGAEQRVGGQSLRVKTTTKRGLVNRIEGKQVRMFPEGQPLLKLRHLRPLQSKMGLIRASRKEGFRGVVAAVVGEAVVHKALRERRLRQLHLLLRSHEPRQCDSNVPSASCTCFPCIRRIYIPLHLHTALGATGLLLTEIV